MFAVISGEDVGQSIPTSVDQAPWAYEVVSTKMTIYTTKNGQPTQWYVRCNIWL